MSRGKEETLTGSTQEFTQDPFSVVPSSSTFHQRIRPWNQTNFSFKKQVLEPIIFTLEKPEKKSCPQEVCVLLGDMKVSGKGAKTV